jgi:hypothetical protein
VGLDSAMITTSNSVRLYGMWRNGWEYSQWVKVGPQDSSVPAMACAERFQKSGKRIGRIHTRVRYRLSPTTPSRLPQLPQPAFAYCFKEAMSITKRYFTSLLSKRS